MSNHSQYSQERGHGANSNYILPIDHNGSLWGEVSSQESHSLRPQSNYSTLAMPPQGTIVFGHSVEALGHPVGTLSFLFDGLTWVPMPNTWGTPQGSDSFVSYPPTAITNSSSQCSPSRVLGNPERTTEISSCRRVRRRALQSISALYPEHAI
jgi:hypothetical protein